MLSNREREYLEYYQKWEHNHQATVSNRINLENNKENIIKSATVDQITKALAKLRFAHQIVFDYNPQNYFDAVEYTYRAIGTRRLELKVFVFMMNCSYIMSTKQVMNYTMTKDEISRLFGTSNMSNVQPDDIANMKDMLIKLINRDFSTVTILSYLKLILNFQDEISQVQLNVIDLAMILSSSCYLTKYSKGCQALSLITWVARHNDINPKIQKNLSLLPPIPTLFFSPMRISQISQYLQITQAQINGCCRDMQEFYIRYYTNLFNRKELEKIPRPKRFWTKPFDMILEENETESESKDYSYRPLSYSFKHMRRPSAPNRPRSKHHNIRRYKSTTR